MPVSLHTLTFTSRSLLNHAIVRSKFLPRPLLHYRGLSVPISPSTETNCYLEKLSGKDTGIAILNLNRPKAKNALSRKLLDEFRNILTEVRFGGETRVLIVRSLVDGVFCAGADLKERATMSQSEVTQFLYSLRNTFRELETLPVPTIASIDGAALGGGLEMALCCDLRVGGANAKLGLVETKLAIIPGAGGTQRLPRLIGLSRAKELIFTGRILNASTAHEYGILNRTSIEPSSFDVTLTLARDILPTGPIAVKMAKLAVDRGSQVEIDSGLDIEQACYAQVIPTEDRLEGLKAFAEKRSPIYKGQ